MRRPAYLFTIIAIFLCSFTVSLQPTSKILVIGDSISIGYFPFVKESLKSKAEVFHNPGNAQHTGTGLKNIENWIGDEKWDIIQFNWGLWDLCYRHPDSKIQGKRDKVNGTIFYILEEYGKNLEALVLKLKSLSDAKLIFVSTSYVPKEEAGRYAKDAILYNRVAKKIMKKHGIAVNDIFKKSKAIHKQHGNGNDNVHFSKQGSEQLGAIITNYLEKELYASKK